MYFFLRKKFQPELIRKYGYPEESHEVETEDGYLITMHRIPGLKVNPNGVGKGTPVMLMHGLLSSSADWVINGPGKALGLLKNIYYCLFVFFFKFLLLICVRF